MRQNRIVLLRTCNVVLLCLVVSCSLVIDKVIKAISQEEAEVVRDDCVAESLRLLQVLADRIAPLARAVGPEELEAAALELDCEFDGQQIYCFELGVLLQLEQRLDGVTMNVQGIDPRHGISGELSMYDDPGRGLVFAGVLHRLSPNGCEAILEFEELVALEAYGLPDGSLGLYFREGAVDVTVRAPDDEPLAHGSAALSGRHAVVVLNFEGLSLLDELALD